MSALVDLMEQKKELTEEVNRLNLEYVFISNNYHTRKNRAWLQTNFKNLGLTNDKQRTAYVDDNCRHLKNNKELLAVEIENMKRDLYFLDQQIEVEMISIGAML